MWTAWNLHHRHGREKCWPMTKRSSGQRQKYVPTLIPFFVSDRWKIFQEQQKDGKAKLKISRSNSSFQDAVGLDGEPIEIEWQTCQCSTALSGTRMTQHVLRMPKKSGITPWNSCKDIARFWVQDRKKSGMAIPTIKKDSGVAPPTKWYTNSKRLVILSSKAPVLWRWFLIQNSCSTQFTLWITSELRIGVINSPWQNKKKDKSVLLWTSKFWPQWNQKKWNCWYLLRPRHLETGCREAGKEGSAYTTLWKNSSNILCLRWRRTKFDRMQTTDGREITPLCRDYSSSWTYRTTRALSANPEGTIIGPVLELHVIKNSFLTDMAKKLQFNHLQTQNTQLTLLFPEKKSVFWMKFMITDKSSGPAMN